MTPKEARVIEQLAENARSLEEVRLAYLFGSRAKGRARRDSDYDVALLLDRSAVADPERRARTFRGLLGPIGRDVPADDLDLVLLNGAPPLLRHHVLRDGVLLYARTPGDPVRFAVETMRDYQDSERRRAEFTRSRVERIRRALAW